MSTKKVMTVNLFMYVQIMALQSLSVHSEGLQWRLLCLGIISDKQLINVAACLQEFPRGEIIK